MRAAAIVVMAALAAAGLRPASAADITEAGAAKLAQHLQDFLATTLGPDVPLPDGLVRAAPAGDHYRVAIPIVGLTVPATGQAGPDVASLTANARPRDDGTWAIDAIHFPTPAGFNLDVPAAREGSGAGRRLPMRTVVTLAGQDTHAVFDPAGVTPSSLITALQGVDVHTTGPDLDQTLHVDREDGTVTLQPAAPGRIDVVENANAKGYVLADRQAGETVFRFAAHTLALQAKLDGLALDQLPPAIQAAIHLGHAASTAPTDQPPAIDHAALGRLIGSLRGLVRGLRIAEQVVGVEFDVRGHQARVDHLGFGMDSRAPANDLTMHLDLTLDGLAVPDLPPALAADLPSHVELRPVVSGVDLKALTDIALQAATPSATPGEAEAGLLELFQRGGIHAGLERFAITLGPAAFTGNGQIDVAAKGVTVGHADIAATGFDQLMDQVKHLPEAGGALPALALLRGFAKTDGDRLTWAVAMDKDHRILINGVDVSQLTGGP